MSESDNAPGEMDNPIANMEQPKKSKKKFWLLGGLGCLGTIILAIVCVAAFWIYAVKPRLEFIAENSMLVTTSPQALELFGEPMTFGTPTLEQEGETMTITTPIDGPEGSGSYVLVGKLQDSTWVRESISVEKDGETYDLEDPEAMFNLDISFGE